MLHQHQSNYDNLALCAWIKGWFEIPKVKEHFYAKKHHHSKMILIKCSKTLIYESQNQFEFIFFQVSAWAQGWPRRRSGKPGAGPGGAMAPPGPGAKKFPGAMAPPGPGPEFATGSLSSAWACMAPAAPSIPKAAVRSLVKGGLPTKNRI